MGTPQGWGWLGLGEGDATGLGLVLGLGEGDATGLGLGEGDAAGLGLGLGLGEGDATGLGLGDGDATGLGLLVLPAGVVLGLGEGDAVGLGVAPGAAGPRNQGRRPTAPSMKSTFSHWMVVQVSASTRPPVSPAGAAQRQAPGPCARAGPGRPAGCAPAGCLLGGRRTRMTCCAAGRQAGCLSIASSSEPKGEVRTAVGIPAPVADTLHTHVHCQQGTTAANGLAGSCWAALSHKAAGRIVDQGEAGL